MSKKEKLEARIRNNPKNVSLEDFETLVNKYGISRWELNTRKPESVMQPLRTKESI
jgi:hypothetical protein